MAAMDEALSQDDTTRAALGHMLAGLVLNVSTTSEALEVGGVIDMAQLGRSLVSYGRPDAAFALLATNGPTSLYHMAASTGTIWAHPGGADGSNGHCGSHNHVMQGGKHTLPLVFACLSALSLSAPRSRLSYALAT
jgi:hypothetical protein